MDGFKSQGSCNSVPEVRGLNLRDGMVGDVAGEGSDAVYVRRVLLRVSEPILVDCSPLDGVGKLSWFRVVAEVVPELD